MRADLAAYKSSTNMKSKSTTDLSGMPEGAAEEVR